MNGFEIPGFLKVLPWLGMIAALICPGCYQSSRGGSADLGSDAGAEEPNPYLEVVDDAYSLDSSDFHGLDSPETGDSEPLVEPVGPPITINEETQRGGSPAIAWNGSGWGVAWGDMSTPMVFRPLDELANPLGPAVEIDTRLRGLHASLEWGNDCYGIAGSTRNYKIAVGTLDRQGNLLGGLTWILNEDVEYPDLAWSTEEGRFLLAYITAEETGMENRVFSNLIDNSAILYGDPVFVGSGIGGVGGPRAIALKNRLALVWPHDDGIWYRGFDWPNAEDSPLPSLVLPMRTTPGIKVEAASFLNYSVILAMDGADVWVVIVDTMTGGVISGPTIVGHSEIEDGKPGIASVVDRGFLGVCYQVGPGPTAGGGGEYGLLFRLVGTDARPLGAELSLVSGLDNICGCAVGWSGSEFIVVYWSCGQDNGSNRIMAQRVRPLI